MGIDPESRNDRESHNNQRCAREGQNPMTDVAHPVAKAGSRCGSSSSTPRFMAVLVPVYWYYYGRTNFLYFCDVALILTLIAIWIEKSAARLHVRGRHHGAADRVGDRFHRHRLVGLPVNGMTAYMFKADSSLFLRGLSLFHGWLPFLLLYLVCEARLRPPRASLLDRAGLGADPDLLLLHAAAEPERRADAGEHQLRLGPQRRRSRRPGCSPALWVIGMMVLMPVICSSAGAYPVRALHAEGTSAELTPMTLASPAIRPSSPRDPAALRAARPARRVARLLRVHRLHRARRDGDRRRQLVRVEPRRRARARRPHHPRRRPLVHADPPRGRRRRSAPSSNAPGRVSAAATMRAMARTTTAAPRWWR